MKPTIYISKPDVEVLSDIISRQDNTEFEWRFGQFNYNKFIPTIKNTEYDSIMNQLKTEAKYTSTQYNSYGYKNGYREQVDISTNDVKYQRKTIIKNYDIHFGKGSARISLSNEVDIQPEIVSNKLPEEFSVDNIYERQIVRNSFHYKYYNIDLSCVKNVDLYRRITVTYELELEFTRKVNIEECVDGLRHILSLLYPSTIFFISQIEHFRVISSFNDLFREEIYKWQARQRGNKPFPKNSIFVYENHPVNIKMKSNINDCAVTNKLDGVNFFLYANGDGIYMVNKNVVEKISNQKIGTVGDVFQCELQNDRLHIFETLRINGNNVSVDIIPELYKRLKLAENVIDKYNNLLRKDSNITVSLKYFSFDNDISLSVKNIMRHISDIDGGLAYELNDGLIFTPKVGRGKIYKYKWVSKMSIDFQLG